MRSSVFFGAGLAVMLAAGWLVFPRTLYRRDPQPVEFSHKVHTGEKGGMKCEDCHGFRDDGSFTGVPVLEKCAACHAAPMGTDPREKTFIDEYVTPAREIAWKIYARQPENAFFSHIRHVKFGKLSCEQCHGDHGRSDTLRPAEIDRISGYSRQTMKMDACIACHEDKGVQASCLGCHK